MSNKEHDAIIIVRKKGGHGGHHGGAWKVAYADFVTAMMAFFLVMWLVTQSKEVKSAVGGYFRDPGVFEFEKGRGIMPGGPPGIDPGGSPAVSPKEGTVEAEQARFEATADLIRKDLLQVKGFEGLRDQVKFSVTSEGLRIDLVDKQASSFFDSGSAALRGESEQILALIAHELSALTNDVVVEGHTDSRPYAKDDRYGNWELSAERANAARRVMELAGLRPGQVRAVRGYADRQLQMPDLPLDPRNRRVSIVVRSEATRTIEDSLRDPVKPLAEEPAAVPEPPVSSEPAPAEPKRTRASH
ncbi:MAG: flagellar motor protein MotB [Vicinamibacterales bacterium]